MRSPAPDAWIAGVVVDASTKATVANAAVSVFGARSFRPQRVTTSADGKFAFQVPAGRYAVAVLKPEWDATVEDAVAGERPLVIRIQRHTALRQDCAGEITPPTLVSGPTPTLTSEAINDDRRLRASFRCLITAEGVVAGCTVLDSAPSMDMAVIYALQRRRYEPATCAGNPVDFDYLYRFEYRPP